MAALVLVPPSFSCFRVHHLSRKRHLTIAIVLLAATLAVLAALTGALFLGQGGKKGGLAMFFLFFYNLLQ